MKCLAAVVLVFLMFSRTKGQNLYDAQAYYEPMTEDFDVKHRGSVFLPSCMKDLMNCWELVKPDLVCRYGHYYRQTLESICMDLRFHCTEYTGPVPFETVNVSTWDYCAINKNNIANFDLSPAYPNVVRPDNDDAKMWWW